MSRMLGASASKIVDAYHCCERHNPGGRRRAHKSGRRVEERQWRADQDEPGMPRSELGPICPCPCHRGPDCCAICDSDYADLCSPVDSLP